MRKLIFVSAIALLFAVFVQFLVARERLMSVRGAYGQQVPNRRATNAPNRPSDGKLVGSHQSGPYFQSYDYGPGACAGCTSGHVVFPHEAGDSGVRGVP